MNVLQMVVIDDQKSIFIKGFDPQTNEMVFRTSLEPRQLHKETISFQDGLAYTNLYHFNSNFLSKFLHETTINK